MGYTVKKIDTSSKKELLANFLKIKLETVNAKKIQNFIHSFFKNFDDDKDFNELKRNTKFFNVRELGKSGAKVGIIKINRKKFILKYYKLDKSKKYKSDYSLNCIKFYHPLNELIINSIFSNIHLFLSPFKNKIFLKKYKHFFIDVKRIGLNNENSFMITEKVGMNYKNYYFTNLHEIIKNNYCPLLIKHMDNKSMVDNFLGKFVNILQEYFNCLKFLNDNLGFIHTDLKCKNVFVRKNDNHNDKNDGGFILNYIPLISDLDKSTLEINKIKILPMANYLASTLSKFKNTKYSKVYEIRNSCKRNTKLCNYFESYQFDIIVLFFDIYSLLFINVFKKLDVDLDIYTQKLNILNNFVKKTLNLNQEKFNIFYERIIHKYFLKYYESKTLSIHINSMLFYLCRNLYKADKKKSKKKVRNEIKNAV